MTDRLGTLCLISAIALVACGANAEEPTPTSTTVAVSSTDTPAPAPPSTRAPDLTTTTLDTDTPATGEAPQEVLDSILADASERTGLPQGELTVVRSEAVQWPDGALGCPEPGQVYTQAIVPGYWIEISNRDTILDYRSDAAGNFKLCDRPGPVPTLPDR